MSKQELRKSKKERRRNAVTPHHLPVIDREFNFEEVNLGYLKQDEIFVEASRCYMCRKPKCMEACPATFDIRSMMDHVREGRFQEAADVVNDFYCFSSSFNRVCPAFCQDACIAGKKGDPLNILNMKRYLADNFDKPEGYYRVAPSTGIKIAIVGSGPAGATAAHALAKMGHEVTIFEKERKLGGMLALGIPEYRLPDELLQKELRDLENFGIKFITGITFGKDITYADLKDQGYRAVLIAHGAHKPKWIGIPGESKHGVVHAIEFLKRVALGEDPEIGEKVIVVGGGDVAIDAVRVATRLGADASIVYRRAQDQMPATKEEIHETINEGIPIHYLTNPVEILGSEHVEAVKLIKMELGEPDSSGRRSPIQIEGSEYIENVDTVIMAISQEPEYNMLEEEGFELTRWHTFEVDPDTLRTNKIGVFAAGDNVTGPKTAIEAIAMAKKAAKAIDEYVCRYLPKTLPDPFSIEKTSNEE